MSALPHLSDLAAAPLDSLRADVWRAASLAPACAETVPTGEALLDAQLPGGGWPRGALTELLQDPGVHAEWRLLLPALAQCGTGPVALVAAPHRPFAPALQAQGLDAQRLLWLCAANASAADALWASEQALRCAAIDAVLAWLPQARPEQLRRLHSAAAEHHKLLFVVRDARAQAQASPAVLRLHIGPDTDAVLCVHIVKRRGPALQTPLRLAARPAVLLRLLAAHAPLQALSPVPTLQPVMQHHTGPAAPPVRRFAA